MSIGNIIQTDKTCLAGRVTSIQIFDKVVTMRMAVTAGGRHIAPVVSFYDKKLADGINVKDNIMVTGHMQIRGFRRADGRFVFENVIIAEEARKRPRALCDYMDVPDEELRKGGYPDDVNSSFVVGRVDRIYIPESSRSGMAILNIRVRRGDGTSSVTEVSCFNRPAATARKLAKGDLVALCGEVAVSDRPSRDGVTVQNIFCRDIMVLDRAGSARPKGGTGAGAARKTPEAGKPAKPEDPAGRAGKEQDAAGNKEEDTDAADDGGNMEAGSGHGAGDAPESQETDAPQDGGGGMDRDAGDLIRRLLG